jgi:hypothetical protein
VHAKGFGAVLVGAIVVAAPVAAVTLVVPREHEAVEMAKAPKAGSRVPEPVVTSPRGARWCTRKDIRLDELETQPVNSILTLHTVSIKNLGHRSCLLGGRPWIQVAKHTAASVTIQPEDAPFTPEGIPYAGLRFRLEPREEALIGMSAVALCENPVHEATHIPVRVGLVQDRDAGITLHVEACTRSGATLETTPILPPRLAG